jgi:hypothetical protein
VHAREVSCDDRAEIKEEDGESGISIGGCAEGVLRSGDNAMAVNSREVRHASKE